jgi:uroporphyrinogen decarboxylase
MSTDSMTPLERFTAYNRGEPIDRLPCVPIIGNTAARVINVKVSELSRDGKLLAKAQIEAYRRFNYDIVRVFTDLYVQAEAMGAKIRYPNDETAYLETPALTDIKQIDQLQPADPYRDGNLPRQLEALRITLDTIGREVTVTSALTCPFTNAAFLIGAEELTRLVGKNPEAVHRLCAISLETNLNYAKAIIDAGGSPSLTDAMSSCTIISPKQFKEFSFPYLQKLIAYIHSRDKLVTLHICGKTTKILNQMVEAGADCISIDNAVNLLDAKQQVGHQVRLMGNVKPAEIMLQSTPQEVRHAVIECVKQAYDSPKGYIVASGCSLPTETPFANIDAMLNTVREIGYPVDVAKLEALNS